METQLCPCKPNHIQSCVLHKIFLPSLFFYLVASFLTGFMAKSAMTDVYCFDFPSNSNTGIFHTQSKHIHPFPTDIYCVISKANSFHVLYESILSRTLKDIIIAILLEQKLNQVTFLRLIQLVNVGSSPYNCPTPKSMPFPIHLLSPFFPTPNHLTAIYVY